MFPFCRNIIAYFLGERRTKESGTSGLEVHPKVQRKHMQSTTHLRTSADHYSIYSRAENLSVLTVTAGQPANHWQRVDAPGL